jgi:8-oxo-dGTP pyrophosphatase MutT (NUDIX family)/uncharacterized membrane protein
VLAYSSAGFTAVLGWRLFGERLGRIKVLAVTLSLLGCVFVSGAYDPASWQLNPLGVITGLLSGLAFASYSLMGKEALRRSIDPWTVLLYAFGFAAVFLLVYNWLTPLLPQGVAYGLYTVSLKYLPASVANIIATLEPVMTAAQAFVLLGERFTTPQWIGGVLIVTGVIVLRQEEQADAPPAQGAQEAFTRCLRYQGAIVKDHHLLLIRHQEHASGRDYWIIPGGGRLDGESEEACVAREMKEETNLEVTVRRLLLDEYWETNHGSHHHKTYLCEPLTGQASPGYEPELESSQHYAIVEVKWFDLRSEASWGEKVVRDPITYPLMLKLRAALGYASEPPASAPAIHATPMEP